MSKKLLVVVDVQNDFVTGSLGSKEAEAIVPKIKKEIESLNLEDDLIFTRDTHYDDNYFDTLEGKLLPVKHCVDKTFGHEVVQDLLGLRRSFTFNKNTFGCKNLQYHLELHGDKYDEIHFVGLDSDICVVSNVLVARMVLPNTRIIVHADMCAGSTQERHKASLEVMKSCQIEVVGEENDYC